MDLICKNIWKYLMETIFSFIFVLKIDSSSYIPILCV